MKTEGLLDTYSNGHKGTTTSSSFFTSPWFQYSLSVVCVLSCGSGYTFSAFSPQLKPALKLNQSEVDLIASLHNVGGNLGPLVGLFIALSSISTVCLVSGTLGCAAYVLQGLAVRHVEGFAFFQQPAVFALLYALCGFTATTLYCLTLQLAVENVSPRYRGLSLGGLIAVYALSAAIMTEIYNWDETFRGEDCGGYLIFNGVFFVIACIIGAIGLKRKQQRGGGQHREEEQLYSQREGESTSIQSTAASNVDGDVQPGESLTAPPRPSKRDIVYRYIIILWFLIRSPLFWLLFLTFTTLTSGGYMMINNVGQMVQSLNNNKADSSFTGNLIILMAFTNCAGRMASGFTDYFPIKRGYWLLVAALVVGVGQILNIFTVHHKEDYYAPCCLITFAYGVTWSLLPTVCSELFESNEFVINFGWLNLATAAASAITNSIVGKLYDEEGSNCVGEDCFRSSFIMGASVAAGSMVLVLLLGPHTLKGKKTRDEEKLVVD